MSSKLSNLSDSDIDLLKETICQDFSASELALFVVSCDQTGLNPFTRQIYAILNSPNDPKWRKLLIITSIDGLRIIAERTGKYLGQTPQEWCGADSVWRDVWVSNSPPLAARCGVIKAGNSHPIYAVAHWNEFTKAGKVTGTWQNMPKLMLSKCAESLALRKAFPQDLSGLYSEDEMNQSFENHTQSVTLAKQKTSDFITVEKFKQMISVCLNREAVSAIYSALPSYLKESDKREPYVQLCKLKCDTFNPLNVEFEAIDKLNNQPDLIEYFANLHPELQENEELIARLNLRKSEILIELAAK